MLPDDLPPSGKYVWDRKRHVLVYTIGFVLFVTSSGAIVQDRAAVRICLPETTEAFTPGIIRLILLPASPLSNVLQAD